MELTRNKFGNLQDPDTLFVFREGFIPMVFGRQNPKTGYMFELSDKDKEYIQAQGWTISDYTHYNPAYWPYR